MLDAGGSQKVPLKTVRPDEGCHSGINLIQQGEYHVIHQLSSKFIASCVTYPQKARMSLLVEPALKSYVACR